MVVGSWLQSPFGRFADVMIEMSDGERVLVAPSADIAEFVSTTYTFDRISLGEVTSDVSRDRFNLTGPDLEISGRVGGPAPFDKLLRLVPSRLACAPAWLRVIDPIAARLVPGVRTAGSAGHGRREYYGVTRTRRIDAVDAVYRGVHLGAVTALHPPVRFGFSSAPSTPQLVSVTTTIDLP
jgi:hypothetical protein